MRVVKGDIQTIEKENLMNLRTFLTIAAVVALVFALGLILTPAFMATTYGL